MTNTQQMLIDVQGHADVLVPPERALVKLAVTKEDADKTKATDAVIASGRAVEAILRRVSTKAYTRPAIETWSRSTVTEPPPPTAASREVPSKFKVYVDFDITVQDFTKLGGLVRDLVQIEHVECQSVEWTLTDETDKLQRAKLRSVAAQDAHLKAKVYAAALHYGRVVCTEAREVARPTGQPVVHRPKPQRQVLVFPQQNTTTDAAEGWEEVGEDEFQYQPEMVKLMAGVFTKFTASFPI